MTYDVYAYDKNWNLIAVMDAYSSLVWTDQRLDAGDFELEMGYNRELWELLVHGTYLQIPDSEHTMRIQKRELKDDYDSQPTMLFSGESMEGVLKQRVVEAEVNLTKYPADVIGTLLDWELISPRDQKRKIPGWTRNSSGWDDLLGRSNIEVQYKGEDLLKVTTDILADHADPRAYLLVRHKTGSEFEILIRSGTDKSWRQENNEWVTFSYEYNNFSNSKFGNDISDYLTHVYVCSSRSENNQTIDEIQCAYRIGDPSGLDRYEDFQTANIQYNTQQNGGNISLPAFRQKLLNYGQTIITTHSGERTFTAGLNTHTQFTYGVDFAIGDVVNVADRFGNSCACSIDSVTISYDQDGLNIEPSFSAVEFF